MGAAGLHRDRFRQNAQRDFGGGLSSDVEAGRNPDSRELSFIDPAFAQEVEYRAATLAAAKQSDIGRVAAKHRLQHRNVILVVVRYEYDQRR